MHIFIVASPLQLLNSIEAANHFQTINNVLIFLKTDDRNYDQMKKLLLYFKWDNIVYFDLPKTNLDRLLFTIKFNFLMKNIVLNDIESIFYGEYRSEHIQHIVNYFNCDKNYLVDDGLATLNINEKQKITFNGKIRLFLYRLFFYKLKKNKFVLFSIFDIEQNNSIKNNYSFLKKLNKDKSIEQTVYFIGQPLVELSMISRDQYKIELEKIIQFYTPKTFIYILHRREKEENIKALSIELDFQYKRYDKLIELEMIMDTKLPSEIATFYSSAIVTLKYLFTEPSYKAFKLNIADLNINSYNKEAIEKCYIEFKDNQIEVVEK